MMNAECGMMNEGHIVFYHSTCLTFIIQSFRIHHFFSVRADRFALARRAVGRERLARGLLRFQAERPVGLHERVYVARALVDDGGLAVPQVALDGVVVRVTV